MGIFDGLIQSMGERLGNVAMPSDPLTRVTGIMKDPFGNLAQPGSDPMARLVGTNQDPFTTPGSMRDPFQGTTGRGTLGEPFDSLVFMSPADIALRAEERKKALTRTYEPKPGSGNTSPSGDGGAGGGTSKWRGMIEQVANEVGIDADVIQAIMMLESDGNEKSTSPAGAIGLMQVMPFHFGAADGDPYNPGVNIRKGAQILRDNFARYGSWDKAAAAYLGAIDANGNITNDKDAYGTNGFTYVQKFNSNLNRIKSAPRGNAGGVSSITGGKGTVMQEFGDTDFSRANSSIYEYGKTYGVTGHTGLDIGMDVGTILRIPKNAIVINAGGTGVFCDDYVSCGAGSKAGELKVQLEDGSQLILGHMRNISVQVGQKLVAGQIVGTSGDSGGAHVHIEYRLRDPSMPSGFRIVDPRKYL